MDKPYSDEQIQAAKVLDGLPDSQTINDALRSLRRVILGFVAALLAATVAVVVLAVANASKSHEDREAREAAVAAALEAQHGREVAECARLFDNSVSDARDVKSDAMDDVTLELGRQLLEAGAVHPPAPFDPTPIFAAVAKRDQAKVAYDSASKARDDWLAAGSPLPCPIRAGP